MRIQRKWRRAWQRGKRSFYKGWRLRLRQQAFIVSAQRKNKQSTCSDMIAHWTSTAAAALMLTAGASVLAAPVSHDAVNNIHTDGRTNTSFTVSGNVNNITTGTVSGVNGLNSFIQFNVKAGNTVNLFVPTGASNLINLVSGGQSQINGILNSVKNNAIGGNVFFLNPSGVVVGAGGSINAGSLALYTPKQSFIDDFFDSSNLPKDSALAQVTDGTLPVSASGLISIEGTVNTISGVKFNAGGATIASSGVVNTGAVFTASASFDRVVNINAWAGAGSAPTVIAANQDGSIEIVAADSIDIKGTIATAGDQSLSAPAISLGGKLLTGGGSFIAHSKDSIQVDSGAIISTRKVADGALLASHADDNLFSTGDSGDITLTVNHETYKERANIEISGGAKLLSFASNGPGTSYRSGDISVIASSQDRLYAWAMTGPDARVTVGDALLKGNKITVQAVAKNDASKDPSFDTLENNSENSASLEDLKNSSDDFLTTLGNLRVGVVVSNVHATAKVTLNDKAKLQADKDVLVSSVASSAVNSTLLSVVGGAGVALSKAEAETIVKKGAEITAGNAVEVAADTKNTINMSTMTAPYLSGKVPLNIMVTYAGMDSDSRSVVEAGAAIKAGGAVDVTAGSIKDMTASASADSPGGGYFSAGVAISKSDVKAAAEVAGSIVAGGDVTVDAKIDTLQNKVWSASSVGDGEPGSGLDLAVDWVANGIAPKLIKPGKASVPPSVGITGATAITLSNNTATANITSTGENYVRSNGNINVSSDVIDLLKSGAIARQMQREENSVLNQPTEANKKAAGVSAAILYSEYDNSSSAYIGDDAVVDAKKKLSVDSAIHIPLPNNWADSGKVKENVTNAFMSDTLGIANAMFSSWAQSSSDAGKGTGSASVNITNLTNDAKAYIGKRAKINQNTAFNHDQTQNDVSVTALTEATTLTMSGMLKSPLADLIKAGRDKTDPMLSAFGSTSGGSGVGGSVLVTFENNTTKAYLDADSQVNAHDLTVAATTAVKNISIGAAGGKSDKAGFNGTATVNDINHTTYAQIIESAATASNKISVKADDSLYNIDAAGGVTEAGSVGIGVSIASNKIVRDTQASASGALFAADTLAVNAANTGLAVTVSLAGSVTADSPEPSPEPEPEDSSDPVEYIRFLFGEDADATDPLAKVSEEAPGVPAKDASGQQAKSGISVAGNVSINMTDETAIASVGNSASDTIITAKNSNVEAENGTSIYAVSGAVGVAANADGSSTGIGGAFMLNKVNETTQAKADNAAITITGATVADSLNLTATNHADIVSIAASGGVSPNGAGIAGQVSLNMIDNTTQAGIDNSSVTTARPVSVSAADKANITAVGGAAAYGGKAGFGASVAVNLIKNTTDAHVAKSTLTGLTSDSDLEVKAAEESKIVAVTAASGASKGSMAGAFSATGNSLTNTTTASIAGVKAGVSRAVDSLGDAAIEAEDVTQVTSIAGSAGVTGSGSGVGLGASASVLVTDNTVNAYVGDNTSIKANDASVSAQSAQQAVTIAAGGSGGGSLGIAGSASTNVLKQSTDSAIGKQAVIDANGNVSVNSSNTMSVTGLAGALGIGKMAGIGVAADVSVITTQTTAYIDSGAAVTAKNNVIVDAASKENVISLAGGVAGGGKAGVAGSASVHVMNTDTETFIGRVGDIAATRASVTADGSVAVAASDDSTFTGVAGSASLGGTAGVDASAAVDVMTKNTSATIGDYASIQAKGLGEGVTVDRGSFELSYQDYTEDDIAAPSLSTNGYGDIDNQGIAKKRTAESVNGAMNGVAVTAVSQNTIYSVAAGASASGTVATTGSAAVNAVKNTTSAHIGKQAKVNTDITGAAAQSVLVAAASDYAKLGVGGALAGSGSVGVGAGADISVLSNTTQAYVDQDAQVKAFKDIQVKAASSQDIISVAAALGASGSVGVAGAVTTNVIDSHTTAYIGSGVTATAGNSVEVAAKDTTEIVSVAGGAGIGLGTIGVGGSVSVTTIHKATAAYIDSGAIVDANAQSADTVTVYTGENDNNGKQLVKQARGVSVKAESSEKITDVAASGGGGLYAGVAGAVAVNVDKSTTKAYIGDNAKVNTYSTAANTAQAVNLAATNDVRLLSVKRRGRWWHGWRVWWRGCRYCEE